MAEIQDKVICLSGEKVNLRPFDIATDFDLFYKWINDCEIIRYLLRIIPTYRHQQLSWFRNLPNSTDIVFTIETVSGEIIGTIGLENLNLVNGTAWTWQLIGEKQFWGKGLATEAKILLLDFGFNTLRLEKLCAEVIASNSSSLRYNEKTGFRVEGRLRNQIFRDGEQHDLIILGILREEFTKILDEYRKNLK